MGGSSSINGMVYVRGHAKDYDTWEEMGAQGWSYADVLPYFQRMEHWHGEPDGQPAGDVGAFAAMMGRCTSPAGRAATRCSTPLSRRASRRAIR